MTASYRAEIAVSGDRARAAVSAAAETWGAELEPDAWGGRLVLPVNAGLRQGVLTGTLEVRASGPGSEVEIRIDESEYHLHWQATGIIVVGAVGCLVLLAWPLFPALLAFAPLGIVMALAAWFLIASRLRSNGPLEFLALVEEIATHGLPEGEP